MISAKDGFVVFTSRAPRTGRLRCHRVPSCAVLVVLLCVPVLCIGTAADVLGESRPLAASVLPAARVMANQVLSIIDDAPSEAPSEERTAKANRPISLAVDNWSSTDALWGEAFGGAAQATGETVAGPVAGLDSGSTASRAAGAALVADLLLASAADEPKAQGDLPRADPPDSVEDTLIASVSVDENQARRINVVQNSTVTIDLKVPVDRAEVADPDIVDVLVVTPKRIILTGLSQGTTQLILQMGQDRRAFNVTVELDLVRLGELIKSIAPTSDVKLRSVNGTIVLRGSVSDSTMADQIEELAALVQGGDVRNHLDVAGVQQTMLRVVVAEVNREAIRQLGINWSIGASDWSRDFFMANNVGQINPTIFGTTGAANVLTGQQIFSMAPLGNGPTTNLTFGFPRAEFQMFLNALRENSLARTLAEPNLVAYSGQTATFLAGGEVPMTVVSSSGGTSNVSIVYHEFGVRLGFTPTILGGQVIRLHVMSELSEPVPQQATVGGLPVFSFNTRRVETTIECGNGQTFAIAGLLSENVTAIASKIPGLGDLPILGALFSSTSYEKSETEMVVLVTPQLVEPLDPQQVPPPPGSLSTEPTDVELFGLHKLEGEPRAVVDTGGIPRRHAPVNVHATTSAEWTTAQFALRGPWGLAGFSESN